MNRRCTMWMRCLALLALALSLGTSGCLGRSPDVKHFMLGANASSESNQRAPELSVLVGPIRLPSYLERPQIARRGTGGEIELDQFNRWLGGFETNLTTALAADLRSELGGVRVVGYPSKAPFPIDYSVRIHVDEWIVDDTNTLQVKLRWAIAGSEPDTAPELSAYQQAVSLKGRSIESLVDAHDSAISGLALAIADELVGEAANP